MRSVANPTSWATFCVTYWLSPVMMTTENAVAFRASSTAEIPSLGGSRKAANPASVTSRSLATA